MANQSGNLFIFASVWSVFWVYVQKEMMGDRGSFMMVKGDTIQISTGFSKHLYQFSGAISVEIVSNVWHIACLGILDGVSLSCSLT